MQLTRCCPGCGLEIPPNTDLRKKYCTVICGRRHRNRKYAHANPDKILENRLKQNSNTVGRILSRVKGRCKATGKAFDIDASDIVIPEFCPVLGIKLNPRNRGVGYHPDSPSVDRINNDKGYVKGNVRVISARANLLKNDATVEELTLVLEDLKRCKSR